MKLVPAVGAVGIQHLVGLPLPAKITERDVLDCVAWRREGWELRARWAEGRTLAVAENRIAAGARLLDHLALEKAA